MDPKLDLSKLPSVLADLGSWTHPTPLSLPPPDRLPTNQNKENLPAPRCPTGQGKTGSLEHGFSGRAGRLLTMLSSSSPGKKSDRLYQNTPKLGLVMSACQAVLQFVDSDVTLHGSLLDTGIDCIILFWLHDCVKTIQLRIYTFGYMDPCLLKPLKSSYFRVMSGRCTPLGGQLITGASKCFF